MQNVSIYFFVHYLHSFKSQNYKVFDFFLLIHNMHKLTLIHVIRYRELSGLLPVNNLIPVEQPEIPSHQENLMREAY